MRSRQAAQFYGARRLEMAAIYPSKHTERTKAPVRRTRGSQNPDQIGAKLFTHHELIRMESDRQVKMGMLLEMSIPNLPCSIAKLVMHADPVVYVTRLHVNLSAPSMESINAIPGTGAHCHRKHCVTQDWERLGLQKL